MKSFKNIIVIALMTFTMFVSCKKESINPSNTSLGVKIQAINKSFSVKSALLTTPGFIWDSGFINVSKIEFEAEKRENEMSHDSSENHFEWNGPKKIDLFNLNSIVGDISIQNGIYDEISIKVKAFKADAGTSPVFYLSGTYTNSSGSLIAIVVIVNEDIEFKVKNEGPGLNAVNDYTSLINLNLTLLMAGIKSTDLDGATLTTGKIILSSTSNVSLYNKINTNLSSCGESEFSKGKGSDTKHGNGSDSGTGYGSDSGSGSNY